MTGILKVSSQVPTTHSGGEPVYKVSCLANGSCSHGRGKPALKLHKCKTKTKTNTITEVETVERQIQPAGWRKSTLKFLSFRLLPPQFSDIIKQHRLSLRIKQESIFRTQINAELYKGPHLSSLTLFNWSFCPKAPWW